jgi:hypothetical protein
MNAAFRELVGLGGNKVPRARKLEVVESAERKFVQQAAGTPHPMDSRTVRERHFDSEARVRTAPSAVEVHPPAARRDDPDQHALSG